MNSILEKTDGAQIPEHPIDRACRILGINNSQLAEKLGLTKGTVSIWKNEEGDVPAHHAARIEELTEGLVRCEEMNSKVPWYVIEQRHQRELQKNGTALAE